MRAGVIGTIGPGVPSSLKYSTKSHQTRMSAIHADASASSLSASAVAASRAALLVLGFSTRSLSSCTRWIALLAACILSLEKARGRYLMEIGRASCRERVEISGGGVVV